jgi:hypothetical protein
MHLWFELSSWVNNSCRVNRIVQVSHSQHVNTYQCNNRKKSCPFSSVGTSRYVQRCGFVYRNWWWTFLSVCCHCVKNAVQCVGVCVLTALDWSHLSNTWTCFVRWFVPNCTRCGTPITILHIPTEFPRYDCTIYILFYGRVRRMTVNDCCSLCLKM